MTEFALRYSSVEDLQIDMTPCISDPSTLVSQQSFKVPFSGLVNSTGRKIIFDSS